MSRSVLRSRGETWLPEAECVGARTISKLGLTLGLGDARNYLKGKVLWHGQEHRHARVTLSAVAAPHHGT